MARLKPRYSADRAVREYTEQHHLPAAAAYRQRTTYKSAVGKKVARWRHNPEQKWAGLHFGEVKVETHGSEHVFEIEVFLNDLGPTAVRVELFAERVNGDCSARWEMTRIRQLAGASRGDAYRAVVPATRSATDYTARVIPQYPGVAVPMEAFHILWSDDSISS